MNKRVIIISSMRMLFLFLLIDKRRLGMFLYFLIKLNLKLNLHLSFIVLILSLIYYLKKLFMKLN